MYYMEKIGADPEVFITDEKGEIISGIGLIGGTKKEPREVSCGAVQEDNVLGEFNIRPAVSRSAFVWNIITVMAEMKKIIGTKNIKVVSSHEFTKKALRQAGEKAMEFGCDPDYNSWTRDINPAPSACTNLRTGGGHVHVSFNVLDKDVDTFNAASMMDFYLGLPSVIVDTDQRRRELYGKAGACRPKLVENGDDYNGVEYRTLSNFWVSDKRLMHWVYDNTKLAIENLHRLEEFTNIIDGESVQDIINNGRAKEAEEILAMFGIPLPPEVHYAA